MHVFPNGFSVFSYTLYGFGNYVVILNIHFHFFFCLVKYVPIVDETICLLSAKCRTYYISYDKNIFLYTIYYTTRYRPRVRSKDAVHAINAYIIYVVSYFCSYKDIKPFFYSNLSLYILLYSSLKNILKDDYTSSDNSFFTDSTFSNSAFSIFLLNENIGDKNVFYSNFSDIF